ncbi:MAG: DUF4287 domain-containing protein [Pseudomonadota bacterium]
MAKSPEEMAQSMIANMPEKTGKPLEDWLAVVKASGLGKHGEIVKLLKSEHGMGHGFANLVAHSALNAAPTDSGDLVEAQYSGGKAGLRPIYDAVHAYAATLGADVEVAPKKTSVSFRRSKQFACATPATKSRVDLGIQLKGAKATDRLLALKPGSMTSHTVRLERPDDFDDEVKAWVKAAYEAA